MSAHNFNFGTQAVIFDNNGEILRTIGSPGTEKSDLEGEVSLTKHDSSGKCIQTIVQPMRSFTKGFLYAFLYGFRLARKLTNSQTDGLCIGNASISGSVLNTPTQGTGYTVVWGDAQNNTINYQVAVNDNYIEVIVMCAPTVKDVTRISVGGTEYTYKDINFVGLGQFNGVENTKCWTCLDAFPKMTLNRGEAISVTIRIRFPKSAFKSLTSNWVYNYFNDLGDTTRTFKNTSGTPVPGYIRSTFTSANGINSCKTFATVENLKIVLGTSSAPVTFDDYAITTEDLQNKLATSRMVYPVGIGTASQIEIVGGTTARIVYYQDFTCTADSPVTIKEAGLVAREIRADSGTTGITATGEYLLARWLLDDIVLERGQTLRVYFQPQVTG